MGRTAGERLSQLRADYRVAERFIKQADQDKQFAEFAKHITAGWCWIPVTMLAGLVERIDPERRWLLELALLEADGWRVTGEYIRGPQAYPEIPVRPPRVDVPTSADDRGGSSGGGGGGSGREMTIEEAREEQRARQEHIAWLQSLADREEWDRRQEWRAWMHRDPWVLPAACPTPRGHPAKSSGRVQGPHEHSEQRSPGDDRRGETRSSRRPSQEDAEVIRMSQWAEIRHLHLVERVPKKRSRGG